MKDDEILRQARERMDDAIDADRENREEALADLDALCGKQWPDDIRTEREADNRPCLTINRLPQFVRQVTGDLRNMNPAINITPGDSESSEEMAEIIEGLIRQIQYKSDASSVYELAAERAAQCGFGYFRVRSDYENETSFNQEILIEGIPNPFSVYFDPASRMPTREDAEFCFITETMKEEDFKKDYPKASLVSVDSDGQTDKLNHWRDGEGGVVVSEYFWKEYKDRTLALLEDGSAVIDPVAPLRIMRTRKVEVPTVKWAKISGKDVLEGPVDVPCKYIPVIAVLGEEMPVGDKVVRTSVIRFARDPQQLYNYWRSAQTEMVALQPKAPFLVTIKQVAGLEALWAAANQSNAAYLPYNPDEKAPGAPQRATPPISSSGMQQEVMTAAEDMKATTGIYDAGLGNRSNEQSGVAIRQRQMESDISNSVYADNMAKSIAYCGRIIVNMIPKIYDTARILPILNKDNTQKMVPVNGVAVSIDGIEAVNNLKSGNYDVRVNVGPNYSTKRQETAESMMDFLRAFPAAAQVAGDLVAENMDWPGADRFAERLKKLLPPGVRDMEDMSPEEQQGIAAEQQKQAQMQQMQAVMAEAEVRKTVSEAKEAEADAEKTRVEAAKEALELALANGQVNAVIAQAVQSEVVRVLQAMQQSQQPQGF